MRIIIYLLISGVALTSLGQSLQSRMSEALDIHVKAKTVHEEVKAMEAFAQVTEDFPNEWLPKFWAAYMCTQVGRLEVRVDDFPEHLSAKGLLKDAEKYLKDIYKKKDGFSKREMTDVILLDALITRFTGSYADRDKEKSYYDLEKVKYQEATTYDPESPNLYTVFAITLIDQSNEPNKPHVYMDLVNAIGLLDHADRLFGKEPNRAMTTNYSVDFVKFWRGRAVKQLTELQSSE